MAYEFLSEAFRRKFSPQSKIGGSVSRPVAPISLGSQPPVLAAPLEAVPEISDEAGADAWKQSAGYWQAQTEAQKQAGVGTPVNRTYDPNDFINRGAGWTPPANMPKLATGGGDQGQSQPFSFVSQLQRLQEIDPQTYGQPGGGGGEPEVPDLGSMAPGQAIQAKNRYRAALRAYERGQALGMERQKLGMEGQRIAGEAEGRRLQYGVGMAGVGERRYATDVGAETAARGQDISAEGQQLQYAGTIAGHLQRQQEAEARAAQEAAKAAMEQIKFGQTLQAGPEELVLNPSTGMMEPRKQYFTPSAQGLVKFGGQPQAGANSAEAIKAAVAAGTMTREAAKAQLQQLGYK